MRVLRHDDVLFVQVERLVEAFAQLWQVLQRAAEERHVSADGAAARQAGNSLRHDRLEDGRGDVLFARAFVQERLDVRLREHAAATGNGIDSPMVRRQLVQTASVGVQQRRHLVDERTGAACTGAVHALLDALVEIDDFGILAAQLDSDVSLRNKGLHRRLGSDNLLHELDAEPLGQQQTARPGDGDGHALFAELFGRFLQHFDNGGAHVSVMAAVDRPFDVVRCVEHRKLYRGGPDVDADAQRIVRVRLRLVSHDGFSFWSKNVQSNSSFRYSVMASPGLMKSSLTAMRAISSELSCMPVSTQRSITPRYADAKNAV